MFHPHPTIDAASPDSAFGRRPPDDAAFHVALRLCAVPAEVARARREARHLGERAGLTPPCCADVALAVGEICSNVVVHAYRDRHTPGVFVLTFDGSPGRLDVLVADEGRGIAPRHDSPGAGYGLPLVATIASALEIGVRPGGGTEVRMSFVAAG